MSVGFRCGIWAVLLLLGHSTAAVQQTSGVVPADLLTAVKWPLSEFSRLAAKVTPAGFEMREAEDVAPLRPPDLTKGTTTVSLTDLVAAFNRANRSYRAEVIAGVFVVRPIDGRSSFLDGPSQITEPTKQIGVMQSLRVIFSPLDSKLLGPSLGSAVGKGAAAALSTPIALDGSKPRRVIDTLNQVAVQAPGAWQVITRRGTEGTEIVRFAFIHLDASRTAVRLPGH